MKLASRIVPVTILLLAIACRGAAPAKGPQRAGGVAVRTAPVTIRDVVYEIRALGSLEAPERVQVVAEVEGAVAEVLFNDQMSQGFVLLTLNRNEAKADMMAVSTITSKNFTTRVVKSFRAVPDGKGVSGLSETGHKD